MKSEALDLTLDTFTEDHVPLVTEVTGQTRAQQTLALTLRSEQRINAQRRAFEKLIQSAREEHAARHEEFEQDMAARRRKGVFTSSEAKRVAWFALVSASVLSFIFGTFIGGL